MPEEEEFEYTKGVIRRPRSKKDRQCNDQEKRTKRQSDLHNTKHKTRDCSRIES
jgi:hypothetical protein